MDNKIDILSKYPNCKVRYKGDETTSKGNKKLVGYVTGLDFERGHPDCTLIDIDEGNECVFDVRPDNVTPILRPMSAMDKKEVLRYCFIRFPLPLTSWNTGREKLDGWKCDYDADGWHVKNKYNDYTYSFNENAEMIIVNTDRDTLEPEMNIVEGVDYLRSISIDIDNLITSGQAEVEQ